ncbi:MAG: hypothetical protein FJ333_11435, partial [Sphingomonadales bacterium]|nr:hypothetical protein [Sphingomonadales bacterium]
MIIEGVCYEKLGKDLPGRIRFFLTESQASDEEPILEAGRQSIPTDEWMVSFVDLPMPDYYRNKATFIPRLVDQTAKNSCIGLHHAAQRLLANDLQQTAFICIKHFTIGTKLGCKCFDKICISPLMWTTVFCYLDWAIGPGEHRLVVFRNSEDPTSNEHRTAWAARVGEGFEAGTIDMPPGNWCTSLKLVPNLERAIFLTDTYQAHLDIIRNALHTTIAKIHHTEPMDTGAQVVPDVQANLAPPEEFASDVTVVSTSPGCNLIIDPSANFVHLPPELTTMGELVYDWRSQLVCHSGEAIAVEIVGRGNHCVFKDRKGKNHIMFHNVSQEDQDVRVG